MRKELEQAASAAMESIAVAPNYADGHGLLALINNNLGRPEKAIEQIQKGVQLNPSYTWDYPYNLGRAYNTLGRYDEAIAALEKALERNENAATIKLFLIASYMRAGREGDAEWQAEELQVVNPDETISHTDSASRTAARRVGSKSVPVRRTCRSAAWKGPPTASEKRDADALDVVSLTLSARLVALVLDKGVGKARTSMEARALSLGFASGSTGQRG